MKKKSDKSVSPKSLPEKQVFEKKEVFQYPQPADTGLPLKKIPGKNPDLQGKQANRTSKEEGLNQGSSEGSAGAFEGFENQQGD